MARTLLFAESGCTVWEETRVTADMVDLLEHTIWGSGDVQYKHFLSDQRIAQIPHPRFFTVRIEEELMIVIIFCRRQLRNRTFACQGYYIRFFAASPKVKGKGLVSQLSGQVMDWVRDQESTPTLFYAAVEDKNISSQRIVGNVGFKSLARVHTLGFSRFSPRQITPLHQLSEAEFDAFYPQLAEQYQHHQCWTTDNFPIAPGYWVTKHQDKIVLGAQVHQASWTVEKMPGLVGRLLPLTPRIPYVNRIFNAKDFRFLTIEALYIHPGYEGELTAFLESLLAQFQQHALLSWWDERDPTYQYLSQQTNLGILHQFTQNATAAFIGSPVALNEDQQASLAEGPFYIANLDYI